MDTIEFECLREQNAYFIDLGSTLEMFSSETLRILADTDSVPQWRHARAAWHNDHVLPGRSLRQRRAVAWASAAQVLTPTIQKTIEALVVADRIVLDGLLCLDPARLGCDLEASLPARRGILARVSIAESTRREIWQVLNEYRGRELEERYGNPSSPAGVQNPFHAADKRAHDYMAQLGHPYSANWFANSPDHPIRAMYYLLLSEKGGVPSLLSPKKLEYIEHLQQRGIQESTGLDTHESICRAIRPEAPAAPRHMLPPIAELVTVTALERKMNLGAATMLVRDSSEAGSYRRKLAELRASFMGATWPLVSEASEYLQKLKEAAAVWQTDPYEGIDYISQVSEIQTLAKLVPHVGSLLGSLLPKRLIKVLGTRLDRSDPVHVFVSRWFRMDEDKLRGLDSQP
jgi:hypothetical protein